MGAGSGLDELDEGGQVGLGSGWGEVELEGDCEDRWRGLKRHLGCILER